MPIAFLFGDGSLVDADANVAVGSATDVDEGIAAADATPTTGYIDFDVNAWNGAAIVTFSLTNLPAEADSINSIILRTRAVVFRGATTDDTSTWTFTCTNANITSFLTYSESDVTGTYSTKFQTMTGSPSVSDVNGTSIQVEQTAFNQSMGPDGLTLKLDCFELEVDYSVPVASGVIPHRTAAINNMLIR